MTAFIRTCTLLMVLSQVVHPNGLTNRQRRRGDKRSSVEQFPTCNFYRRFTGVVRFPIHAIHPDLSPALPCCRLRELDAPAAQVILYPISQVLGVRVELQRLLYLLTGQPVECVDDVDRHRQLNDAFLDLPLYHVDHTIDRAHHRSAVPETVLSISQIRNILQKFSRDPGWQQFFRKASSCY